jgi:D-erythro-7,8-dihydroneopterin triphosphate epimerase
MLDKIHIRDLLVRTIVGINDWEKKRKQDVLISIVLHVDLMKAGKSDLVEDTVNYKTLKDQVITVIEGRSFSLIEGIAQLVAELSLSDPQVAKVDVTVDKPGALRFARSVAVEITREKANG